MITALKAATRRGLVDFHEAGEGFIHFSVANHSFVQDDHIITPFGKFLEEGQEIEVDFDTSGCPVAIRAV